jgi:hypothetical protein
MPSTQTRPESLMYEYEDLASIIIPQETLMSHYEDGHSMPILQRAGILQYELLH